MEKGTGPTLIEFDLSEFELTEIQCTIQKTQNVMFNFLSVCMMTFNCMINAMHIQ